MDMRQQRVSARTNRRRWPSKMRMRLIVPPGILADRMEIKQFSNRRLARYAEVSPGTIDNLLRGDTKSVNKGRTAELICEALDAQIDLYFLPEIPSVAIQENSNALQRGDGGARYPRAKAGRLRTA